MNNLVANWAKGRFIEWGDLAKASVAGEALLVVLYKLAALPSEATLRDCKFLSDVAAAGAVEADFTFTGSRRKVFTGTDVIVTVDLATDKALLDITDPTWEAAGGPSGGGAVNNDIGMMATYFRRVSTDGDTAIRCLSFHNYPASTNGQDFKAVIPLLTSDT